MIIKLFFCRNLVLSYEYLVPFFKMLKRFFLNTFKLLLPFVQYFMTISLKSTSKYQCITLYSSGPRTALANKVASVCKLVNIISVFETRISSIFFYEFFHIHILTSFHFTLLPQEYHPFDSK
ncbi:hypothetical protein CW304_22000 [Bacillus sp. UFRGS-B20]|nr:hypothetical protein CW304_22000 [Bacillus sp. UFRGS-B20]